MAPAPAVRARIRRRFDSPAEDVFDAWIDPQKVRQWFGPGLGEVTRVEIDPRVGGAFTIVQRREAGDAPHTGQYLQLERPRHLSFTWRTPPETDQARIHVEIAPSPDGCELTLTQEMDDKWASFVERAEEAWTRMTDAMATVLEQRADPMRAYRTVTPYLVIRDADAEIRFLTRAFRAEETRCDRGEDGSVLHAELQIGDSMVMLGEAGLHVAPRPASLFLWVPDVDAAYARALEAGATSESAPEDKPYGHRTAGVFDPNGVTWWIGSPLASAR